jgi:hypothetical protein
MDGMQPVVEMNQFVWDGFRTDLADLTAEEADWRPLPQANSINVILRHLRIEGEWHTASLERGEAMPSEPSPALQQAIDAVPLDFQRNLKELEGLYARFLAALHDTTLDGLEQRTKLAYGAAKTPQHFLGFHQVVHLAMHWAQIRTIRTLYKKTRGEPVPARYYPGNVSYPREP